MMTFRLTLLTFSLFSFLASCSIAELELEPNEQNIGMRSSKASHFVLVVPEGQLTNLKSRYNTSYVKASIYDFNKTQMEYHALSATPLLPGSDPLQRKPVIVIRQFDDSPKAALYANRLNRYIDNFEVNVKAFPISEREYLDLVPTENGAKTR